MIDVTIKNVPDDCVDDVKRMAQVAIDRYWQKQKMVVPQANILEYETKIDEFLNSNQMEVKFGRVNPEEIV